MPVNSYSIALRLRRIIYEDAYVAVPVTDAIMKQNPDGTMEFDPDALTAEGIRIGQDARAEWQVESIVTEPHPIQRAAPEERKTFDAFYE